MNQEYIDEIEALYHCTAQGFEHLRFSMDALVDGNGLKALDEGWRARLVFIKVQERLWTLKEAMRRNG